MLSNITLGQYYPANSPVHRMDSSVKLLLTIAYIVIIFLVDQLIGYGYILLYTAFAIFMATIPFKYVLRSLKPLWFILVFTFVLNLFFTDTGNKIFELWIFKITDYGLKQAVFMALRLAFLVAGTSLMTLTTSPIALTDGLERLFSPLKVIKFPAHELAMMMAIALRFIPTLIDETDKIMKAQMARGADFETGNIFHRARSLVPLLVPLFVSAFRRADELAMAMESRCYRGGEGRTRMKVSKIAGVDYIAMASMLVLGAVVILFA